MIKKYCDRCGKEVDSVLYEKIPDPEACHDGTGYRTKKVELCHECHRTVKEATNQFNLSIHKVRIAFYNTLFNMEGQNNENQSKT
jgi:hypothetical protein